MKKKNPNMTYYYLPKVVANAHGMQIAVLLHHFGFWYERAQQSEQNFFEGKYWIRMSQPKIQEYCSCLTLAQVGYYIKKMAANDLIEIGEFNRRKNDRTAWYTLTKKGQEILGKTSKITHEKHEILEETPDENSSHQMISPSHQMIGSIYKEVDIIHRYTYIIEKLEKNSSLHELLAMRYKISIEIVKDQIQHFVKFCESISQPIHNNDKDLFTHFGSWLSKQDLEQFKYANQIDWFIRQFNKISKRDFVITDQIRELFTRQIENGFSGKQMVKAVKNLYSSNDKNAFHVKRGFKFATPEYLLKDGNLNRYLNVKY